MNLFYGVATNGDRQTVGANWRSLFLDGCAATLARQLT